MKPRHNFIADAVLCAVFFALVSSLCAQKAKVLRHNGDPQDWSQHHIVFSRDALARHPELKERELRVLQQTRQRWQAPKGSRFHGGADSLRVSARPPGPRRDWNVSLGAGRLSPHMYPAKFSFDPGAPPDCTNDYVVYGLSAVGSTGGQANLIAFNNLYVNGAGTGFCSGLTDPTVMFAYNTSTAGGGISTSPILSLDGTQIAFVESVSGGAPQSIFHVLTWAANQGTITDSAAPATMSSLQISLFADTTSSPWIDYATDTVYVGDNSGTVYQIMNVFSGTPTLGWSVQVSVGSHLAPPVLDSNLGLLMVGSQDGDLYQIDAASGIVVGDLPVGVGGSSSGILAPPIVDITNGTTFVVSANNGTNAVLEQADTATLTVLSAVDIGEGASGGSTVHLYEPAFSNDYFNYVSGGTNNGIITLCGTGAHDTTPNQYVFGFTGRKMNAAPQIGYPLQLSTSTTDRCTGWTEFYNPNTGPTSTITATSVTTNVLTVTANNANLIVGDEVFLQGTAESVLNGQTVTVASLIGTGPLYSGFTANFTTADYTNPTDTGTASITDTITATSVTSNVLTVTASNSNLTVGEEVYIQGTAENFLNGQTVTVASLTGAGPLYTGFTANFMAADYSDNSDTGLVSAGTDFFFFGLTGDCATVLGGISTTGCVVAIANSDGGSATTTSGVITGGPSGIVVDNYSTAVQASSIYFAAASADSAYKFTQEGLQ